MVFLRSLKRTPTAGIRGYYSGRGEQLTLSDSDHGKRRTHPSNKGEDIEKHSLGVSPKGCFSRATSGWEKPSCITKQTFLSCITFHLRRRNPSFLGLPFPGGVREVPHRLFRIADPHPSREWDTTVHCSERGVLINNKQRRVPDGVKQHPLLLCNPSPICPAIARRNLGETFKFSLRTFLCNATIRIRYAPVDSRFTLREPKILRSSSRNICTHHSSCIPTGSLRPSNGFSAV